MPISRQIETMHESRMFMVTRSGALLRTNGGGRGARSASGGWQIGSLIGPFEALRSAFHSTHQAGHRDTCPPDTGLWRPLALIMRPPLAHFGYFSLWCPSWV